MAGNQAYFVDDSKKYQYPPRGGLLEIPVRSCQKLMKHDFQRLMLVVGDCVQGTWMSSIKDQQCCSCLVSLKFITPNCILKCNS